MSGCLREWRMCVPHVRVVPAQCCCAHLGRLGGGHKRVVFDLWDVRLGALLVTTEAGVRPFIKLG